MHKNLIFRVNSACFCHNLAGKRSLKFVKGTSTVKEDILSPANRFIRRISDKSYPKRTRPLVQNISRKIFHWENFFFLECTDLCEDIIIIFHAVFLLYQIKVLHNLWSIFNMLHGINYRKLLSKQILKLKDGMPNIVIYA